MHFKEIQYGFEYGAAKVERIASDEKKGWVYLAVSTPKHRIEIYVTKTGKVRVYGNSGELSLKSK
jgi:hypothetical protein